MKHENTIMYKIVCNDINITDLYVGQTTNFIVRKNCHKRSCCKDICKNHHFKVYQFIRANGGWNNWSMVEIEKIPCYDSNEAHKRERYWVETLRATLNCKIPSRTDAEYYNDNRESINIKEKNYREANKERLSKIFECQCGGTYIYRQKLRHFESEKHIAHIRNPEIPIKIYAPNIYYIANKERLSEKSECLCGGKYTFKHRFDHLKSKIHMAYIEDSKGSRIDEII
jgi:hypothetical protein